VTGSPKPLRISQPSPSQLLRRVDPRYSPAAIAVRAQGDVQLQAIISRQGTVEQLHAISGHPFLIPLAIDAVRQWRYRPFLLNGEPIEVETTVVVHFRLSQ
jgi:protein TonB